MMFFRILIIVTIISFAFQSVCFSQCDSTQFAPDSLQFVVGNNNYISTLARHGDTLYLGGNFHVISKYTGSFSAVDTGTGMPVDQPTWPKSNGTIHSVVKDGNGGWIIVGVFSRIGDSLRKNIAHISSSGVVSAFKLNVKGDLYSVAYKSDTVYFAGNFDTVNTSKRRYIAAACLSTSTLSSWNPEANGLVRKVIADGNRIYAAGDFTIIGDSNRARVAALDITTGTAHLWNSQQYIGLTVYDLVVRQNDVIIAGSFNSVGGNSTLKKLAILDKATGLATTWTSPFNGSNFSSAAVRKIGVAGNRLFMTGTFTKIGDSSRKRLGAIDLIGKTVLPFNPINTYQITAGNTYAFVFLGNKICYINGSRYGVIATDTVLGNTADTITQICGDEIYDLKVDNNKLYISGEVWGTGAVYREGLAAVNMAKGKILPWNIDFFGSNNVKAMTVDGNRLYIAGQFSRIGGASGTNRLGYASFDISNNHQLTSWNPGSVTSGYDVEQIMIHQNYLYARYDDKFLRCNKSSGVIDSWNVPSTLADPDEVFDMDIHDGEVYLAIENTYSFGSGAPNYILAYKLSNNTWTKSLSHSLSRYVSAKGYGSKLFVTGYHAYNSVNKGPAAYYTPAPFTSTNKSSWSPLYTTNVTGNRILGYSDGKLLMTSSNTPLQNGGIALVDTNGGSVITGWRPDVSSTITAGYYNNNE